MQPCAHNAQSCEQSFATLRMSIPVHLRERSVRPRNLSSLSRALEEARESQQLLTDTPHR